MKNRITIAVLLLVTAIGTYGQDVSFLYDADGNMTTFTYAVTLRSSENTEEEKPVIANLFEREIRIYPNPTKGRIRVDITPWDAKEDNYFHLYTTSGQLIKSQKITSASTELEITGEQGIYLLTVHTGSDVSRWKIIKQ